MFPPEASVPDRGVRKEFPAKTHDGKVVSVTGDKPTTTWGEGKKDCHTVAKGAKVTCDGRASKAASQDDKTVATAL